MRLRDRIKRKGAVPGAPPAPEGVAPAAAPAAPTEESVHHCFSGETRFLTREGARTFNETVGTSQMVLTADPGSPHVRTSGRWIEAEIVAFGEQALSKIILSRNGITKTIYATPGHRWLVRSGKDRSSNRIVTTDELRPGHRLAWLLPQNHLARSTPSPVGIMAGVVFGDGTSTAHGSTVNLWGEKDAQLLQHFPDTIRTTAIKTPGGVDGLTVKDLPRSFKDLPDRSEGTSFLYGWLAGYFAADGSVTNSGQASLSSANRDHLQFVRDLALQLGIGTFGITSKMRSGFGAEPSEIHSLEFIGSTLHPSFFLIAEHRRRFEDRTNSFERIGWQVVSVEDTDRVEEVYCAVVPGTESFVLEDNIWTMNCPFCGSKNITGGSDGTVECGFCSKVIKVYIEPTHPSMPLTVDGQPYQAPGTPEVTGEPVPAANGPAVDPAAATPPGAAQGAPGGIERFRVDGGGPATPAASGSTVERYRTAIFRTASGAELPLDEFLRHLAISHADDRQAVLMQVAASRG